MEKIFNIAIILALIILTGDIYLLITSNRLIHQAEMKKKINSESMNY